MNQTSHQRLLTHAGQAGKKQRYPFSDLLLPGGDTWGGGMGILVPRVFICKWGEGAVIPRWRWNAVSEMGMWRDAAFYSVRILESFSSWCAGISLLWRSAGEMSRVFIPLTRCINWNSLGKEILFPMQISHLSWNLRCLKYDIIMASCTCLRLPHLRYYSPDKTSGLKSWKRDHGQ